MWPELTMVLDWLPLAALLLAADGSALAVSRAWSALSGLAAEDSRGDGWVSVVDLPDRGLLRARLRDAALAGQAGCADVRLAGRWSRWWWRPGPSGRLIVCAAGLGDSAGPGHDDQQQRDRRAPACLVRRSEFVTLTGRALRRVRHHGERVAVAAIRLAGITGADPGSGSGRPGPGPGTEPPGDLLGTVAELVSAAAGPTGVAAQAAPGEFLILLDGLGASRDAGTIADRVREAIAQALAASGPTGGTAVTGVAVAGGPGHGAEELIAQALSAARPASHAAGPGRPVPGQEPASPAALARPAPADTLVHRLSTAGLAIQRASSLADSPVADRLQQALDELDSLIRDIQTAALASPFPP